MTEAKKEFSEKRGEFMLWLGLLLPPVVWALQLQTIYLLIGYNTCEGGSRSPVHITSLICLILSAFGFFVSWRNWMKTGGIEWKSENSGIVPRSRFMAILGVLTGALFSIVIFAQWLPAIYGVPCGK